MSQHRPRPGPQAARRSSVPAALLLSLAAAHAAGGEPAPEPTYEDACANWAPIQYACTVLAAKNSRAKFVAPFRGGVHTVYVSEVLGHCPLTPGHAGLMAFIPEGIQALFIAGEPPDFRSATRSDIRQRLARGSLPIVETSWDDPSGSLRYEETSFVRLLDGGFEATRGDENAAAFLRLRVLNLGAADQVATLRLCVNGSNNGQPRGVSAPEYASALVAAGDRALNATGRVRLLWQAPAGARVEARLRGAVPRVLEWAAGVEAPVERNARAEVPFNRYFSTRGDELHDASKAFDGLGMTYWRPESTIEAGPVAVGLEFPEPRWLRRFSVRFEGDLAPAADGYRLEVLDGEAWKAAPHQVNGKSSEELKGHPEIQAALGSVWTFSLEPLRTRGLRLRIEKMPPGKDRPAIADAQHQYSLDFDPATGAGYWFDTASDYLANVVRFEVPVAARSSADLVAIVPFTPAAAEEADRLAAGSFDAGLVAATAYWESVARGGARLEVPERIVQDVWNVNVPHIFTSAEIDPVNGLAITKTNVGWYEAVWPSLSAPAILALDLRGHHADAARYLEPFLRWQGTVEPPGKFQSREGFLAAADEYTWVRWLSGHGWILWVLSEHFLLSGDREWLDGALPGIIAASDWIERERAANKVEGAGGVRPAHWGLLPPGPTGDGAPNSYSFFGEACAWRGLDAAAAVLRDVGHARAAELTEAAAEYRQCILAAMREGTRLAQPYRLRSGRSIPFVPMDLYNGWKINSGSGPFHRHPWYLDVGPLHAIDQGVVDAESDIAGWMIEIANDHWLKDHLAIDEPWYAPQAAYYFGRDLLPEFLAVYYSLLAEGMDRQVHASVEGHGGVQNLPWGDGEHTRLLRKMLVLEEGEGLQLLRAVPRAWLCQGGRVALKDAPTRFGRMSFAVQSNVLQGRVSATIDSPARKPAPISLRLRHPRALPIQSVTVNGQPHAAFGGEWIHLPAGAGRMEVVAGY